MNTQLVFLDRLELYEKPVKFDAVLKMMDISLPDDTGLFFRLDYFETFNGSYVQKRLIIKNLPGRKVLINKLIERIKPFQITIINYPDTNKQISLSNYIINKIHETKKR